MHAPIAILILAAGASRRMGKIKQLMPWRGGTLLGHAIEEALKSRFRPVLVVVGAHAALIRPEVVRYPVQLVENANWAEGMGSSIRAGVEAIEAMTPRPRGVLIMLADQPRVGSDLLDRMADAHAAGHELVASAYGGSIGVPALLSSRYFPELRALAGDRGAKGLLLTHRDDVLTIPFHDGAVDLDTPADALGL